MPAGYEKSYHGTKYKYLQSIWKNGLKVPGTKLKDGNTVDI